MSLKCNACEEEINTLNVEHVSADIKDCLRFNCPNCGMGSIMEYNKLVESFNQYELS